MCLIKNGEESLQITRKQKNWIEKNTILQNIGKVITERKWNWTDRTHGPHSR